VLLLARKRCACVAMFILMLVVFKTSGTHSFN